MTPTGSTGVSLHGMRPRHREMPETESVTAAPRVFAAVAWLRRTAGFRGSWHRIQNSASAIAPPTASRNRSGIPGRGPKRRSGFMGIRYTWQDSVSSSCCARYGTLRSRCLLLAGIGFNLRRHLDLGTACRLGGVGLRHRVTCLPRRTIAFLIRYAHHDPSRR